MAASRLSVLLLNTSLDWWRKKRRRRKRREDSPAQSKTGRIKAAESVLIKPRGGAAWTRRQIRTTPTEELLQRKHQQLPQIYHAYFSPLRSQSHSCVEEGDVKKQQDLGQSIPL
ncbi:hypothetical protein WMY93_006293 [Mugilogobius chulae]|uniref:Uncharacterized protein n=1 Tax=Mugilogobius chulae TaxID=88201 RepID=A0AAW0PYT8_9GOBI